MSNTCINRGELFSIYCASGEKSCEKKEVQIDNRLQKERKARKSDLR
jgi:hypothetical protein